MKINFNSSFENYLYDLHCILKNMYLEGGKIFLPKNLVIRSLFRVDSENSNSFSIWQYFSENKKFKENCFKFYDFFPNLFTFMAKSDSQITFLT